LFGTHLAANIFLLGVAWQAGLVPVSLESMERAIEWNGVEVAKNRQAFLWGRKYYQDAAWVEAHVSPAVAVAGPETDGPLKLRVRELRAYQDDAYARTYLDFVEEVGRRAPPLLDVVARNLYKLMAYKDEYEVARLLTKPEFEQGLRVTWEAIESISYNVHPPLLRRFGVGRKLKLGPWFRVPLLLLRGLRRLRGTPFDLFGWTAHRRLERELAEWYRGVILRLIDSRWEANLPAALELAALPDRIRGYERIKEASVEETKKAAERMLAAIAATPKPSARLKSSAL
jgi:indolepyruvate ferredoxin oxidoreductase